MKHLGPAGARGSAVKVMTSGRKADATYEKIIAAACDAFAAHGYHGVKISRLCEEAGIANGTFYIYFKNKDILYKAVIDRAVSELMRRLSRPERKGAVPVDRELGDIRTIVAFTKENEALSLAVFNERPIAADAELAVRERLAKQRAEEIAKGQRTGEFRGDVDPMIAALAEVSVTTDILRYWLQHRDRISEDEIVDQIWKLRLTMLYAEHVYGAVVASD